MRRAFPMPPCRRRSRTGKRGIITRRAKPKSTSMQRPPTRLRPPGTRMHRARRRIGTNAERGTRNAEHKGRSRCPWPYPTVPRSDFRVPPLSFCRRLHPDHHPPRLPARPACDLEVIASKEHEGYKIAQRLVDKLKQKFGVPKAAQEEGRPTPPPSPSPTPP